MLGRREWAAAAAAWLAAPAISRADTWPRSRVTIVVPFPAGAATDLGARLYAEQLSALWGQPVVVDNKGGGNGIPGRRIGGARQARRSHDLRDLGDDPGGQSGAVREAALRSDRRLRADHAHGHLALRPAGRCQTARSRARPSSRPSSRPTPGKHNFGAGALPARVASELYKMAAGVEAVYVGYKSNPQAIPDVQSGLLSFMMIDTVNAKIAIDRGALKGLLRDRHRALSAAARHADGGRSRPARRSADHLDRLLCAQGHAARDRRRRSMPTSAPWRPCPRCWRGLTTWAARPSS